MAENIQDEFNQLKQAQADDSNVNQYIDKVDEFMQKLENQREDGQTIYLKNLHDTFQKKPGMLKAISEFANEEGIEAHIVDNVDVIYDDLWNDGRTPNQYYKIILHATGQTLPLNDLSRYNGDRVIESSIVDKEDKAKAFSYAEEMMKHIPEHSLN